jgi:hypothetical protein
MAAGRGSSQNHSRARSGVDGGEKPVVRFDAGSWTVESAFATPNDSPGESLRNQSALDY